MTTNKHLVNNKAIDSNLLNDRQPWSQERLKGKKEQDFMIHLI